MRKIKALLFALALLLAPLAVAGPANALGKVKCDADGTPTITTGNYDPIVNHNGTGSMHEHQFFGNKAWLSNLANPDAANYSDLEAQDNNCRKVLGLGYSADSAGYWVPTLRYVSGPNKGKLIPAQQFTAYYRPTTGVGGPKFGPALPYPADTRLISDSEHYNWSCGQKSGTRSKPVKSIPDCTGLSGGPGLTLTAHIDFPSCWDGVLPNHSADEVGNTNDSAHYRYTKKHVCPAGFTHGVTALRETIQFAYTGDGTDVGLTSDPMMGVTDGQSLHADFWNTWRQDEFTQFIKQCVNGVNYVAKSCDP